MRRNLLVTIVLVILLVATYSMVSANAGPHGGYTATDDACAGCHRAHTAAGPRLLIETSTQALCLTCHGNTATGAVTNVSDGVLEAVAGSNLGTALNGGGFDYYQGSATTSVHDTGATDAWGNDVARGTTAALAAGEMLSCASCHDPHGSTNYRILKTLVNGTDVTVTPVDEGAQVYDAENWPADMSAICAACHSDYHKTAGNQGSILDGTTYTHRIDMQWDAAFAGTANPEVIGFGGFTLPLAATDQPTVGDGLVVCTTCHLPHGSSAAMSGIADGGPTGSGALPGNTTATDSALLRLDNRGVCEVCHQK